MKKIIFVHWGFPYGGAEMVTIDTANFLSCNGWDVTILSDEYYAKNFPTQKTLHFTLMTFPPDVNGREESNKWVADYINERGIRFFVCKDECLIDIKYIKEHTNAKLIYHLHSIPLWEAKQEMENIMKNGFFKERALLNLKLALSRKRVIEKNEKRILSSYESILTQVDAFIVLCNAYKGIINSHTANKYSNKIFPIYNSCENSDIVSLDKAKEIIYIGRLSYPDKRVDRLLQIWSLCQDRIPEWRLRILGDGPELTNLKSKAERLMLRNISFEGWVNDTKPYYNKAAIICLTSSIEGWGLALSDGQCNGVIPIAFNVSKGLEEMLSPNGDNGFLIEPFDYSQYADTIVALANDEKRRKEIQMNVLKRSNAYSRENTGKEWLKMLQQILKQQLTKYEDTI